ncbi:MAG TPA: hypothetical protein VGM19_09650 [Armatimonadota bacterium]
MTTPLVCPYRYLLKGRTFCSLAVEESRYAQSEVIPPTCAACPIPELIREHACGRFSLGVQISVYGGRQVVEMHYVSCEVTVERLLEVDGCTAQACPYWEAFDEEAARRIAEQARERQLEREGQSHQS